MRAVSEDTGAAQLMGININIIITFTFAVGAALAGIGALLYGVQFPVIDPTIGAMLGLKASIPGAMLGGLLLGLLEAIGTQFLGSEWKDVFAFGLLILILILRPNGLMGKTEIERM
jgi:branched-chain amino acid transport system permease protein